MKTRLFFTASPLHRFTEIKLAKEIRLLTIILMLILFEATNSFEQSCNPLPTFNTVFTNQTVSTAQVFTSQNIRITGTVNFNANITMINCDILMDPGAVLNINNSTFTLKSYFANGFGRSHIYGCTQMWGSININANGAINFQNSDITDSRFGIICNQGFSNGICQVTGCTFKNNLQCFSGTNLNNFTFATFSGNSFTGIPKIGTMLPPYQTGNPVNAFNISNCRGIIGTAGTENHVRWMTTGARIVANSNITINNFHFEDCSFGDTQIGLTGPGLGIGVLSISSSLTIQNIFSNNASCRFTSNGTGVVSNSTISLTVKNAIFTWQHTSDISAINSANPYSVDISNNTMTLQAIRQQSIFLDRAPGSLGSGIHTRIQSNAITLPTPPSTGLGLPGNIRFINITTNSNPHDQAVIANNVITCSYGNPIGGIARTIDGIFISMNGDGYQVSGNTINYVNPNGPPNSLVNSVAIGIVSNAGISNIVGPNNVITATRFNNQPNQRESWLRCGVHISNSQNVAVCKNDADDCKHDYHFDMNCSNGEWGRNKMRDGYFGILTSSVTLPNQDYRLNEWIPGSTYNANSADINGAAGLPWRVDGNFPGYMPPIPFSPNSAFFSASNSGASQTPICDAVVPPPGAFGEPPTGTLAVKFLNNDFGLNNPAAWDFERVLLYQMIRFPSTFAGNAAAQQYYNGKMDSPIWKFAKAERMLHDAVAISSGNQTALDNLQASNKVLIDSLGIIEQWEGTDTTTVNSTWQDSKTSLLASLSMNQLQIDAINSTLRAASLSDLETVKTYVNNLPATTTLESNYKFLLTTMVKLNMDETWTNQDTVALRAIAGLCPETDGEAVMIARCLLPVPESYSYPLSGDDPACVQPRNDNMNTRFLSALVNISPNPVNDNLQIEFKGTFSGTVEIISSAGELIQTLTFHDIQVVALETAKMHNGLYFLRFNSPLQRIPSMKFIVAH